jgi:hypothetical protein
VFIFPYSRLKESRDYREIKQKLQKCLLVYISMACSGKDIAVSRYIASRSKYECKFHYHLISVRLQGNLPQPNHRIFNISNPVTWNGLDKMRILVI